MDRKTKELMKAKSTWRVPFPVLEYSSDPCTCGFGPTPRRQSQTCAAIVGCLHKSSYQVLFRSELKYAGRKV
jgi:hypothetical protein